MTLSLLKAITQFRVRHHPTKKLQLRIGVHSGISSAIRCIFGYAQYFFWIRGDLCSLVNWLSASIRFDVLFDSSTLGHFRSLCSRCSGSQAAKVLLVWRFREHRVSNGELRRRFVLSQAKYPVLILRSLYCIIKDILSKMLGCDVWPVLRALMLELLDGAMQRERDSVSWIWFLNSKTVSHNLKHKPLSEAWFHFEISIHSYEDSYHRRHKADSRHVQHFQNHIQGWNPSQGELRLFYLFIVLSSTELYWSARVVGVYHVEISVFFLRYTNQMTFYHLHRARARWWRTFSKQKILHFHRKSACRAHSSRMNIYSRTSSSAKIQYLQTDPQIPAGTTITECLGIILKYQKNYRLNFV